MGRRERPVPGPLGVHMSSTQKRFTGLVNDLVRQVASWAESAGWATAPYSKRMRAPDRSIFEVPSLYLQKGPTRLLLDPIAYDVPGADAAVDLYLMPTYDDMAGLYFGDGRWSIHYDFPTDQKTSGAIGKVESIPLDAGDFLRTLETIASHATPSV